MFQDRCGDGGAPREKRGAGRAAPPTRRPRGAAWKTGLPGEAGSRTETTTRTRRASKTTSRATPPAAGCLTQVRTGGRTANLFWFQFRRETVGSCILSCLVGNTTRRGRLDADVPSEALQRGTPAPATASRTSPRITSCPSRRD